MRFRFAIFDLDGTLVDSLDDLTDACNYALRKSGYPARSRDEVRTFVGNGVLNLVRRCLPAGARDEDNIARVRADFADYYAVHCEDKTMPFPGIPELLETLRSAGIRLAVASNKPDAQTKKICGALFPGLIEVALGQGDRIPPKPDPTGVREILRAMKAEPAVCAYIGDSDVDIHTGNNAGLYTVGVTWGYRTKENIESAGAGVIVHKVEELSQILLDK